MRKCRRKSEELFLSNSKNKPQKSCPPSVDRKKSSGELAGKIRGTSRRRTPRERPAPTSFAPASDRIRRIVVMSIEKQNGQQHSHPKSFPGIYATIFAATPPTTSTRA